MKLNLSQLAVGAMLCASLFACNNPGTKSTSTSQHKVVHIGTFFTAVDYAPFIIAKNKGFFDAKLKNDNASVTYTTFQSLPPLNEALATNKADVVFEAEPPAIVGKAAGIDEKIADVSCSINLGILVSASSKIKSIADLKGKKIALLAGTGVHYGVLKLLSDHHLQKSDVQIIDMAPPDAKNAFETGKVDAWAVWSPFIDQELINGKGRVIPNDSFQIQSILAARGAFIKDSPKLFADVISAFQEAKKWIKDNPAEAQQIVAKELGLTADEIKMAWPHHDWNGKLSPAVVADIQNKADFLVKEKFIDKKVDVKKDLVISTGTAN